MSNLSSRSGSWNDNGQNPHLTGSLEISISPDRIPNLFKGTEITVGQTVDHDTTDYLQAGRGASFMLQQLQYIPEEFDQDNEEIEREAELGPAKRRKKSFFVRDDFISYNKCVKDNEENNDEHHNDSDDLFSDN
ncbi:uncharacterized protein Bfra_011924 [Botrytis fragariae]|uniref:Uncharacterized protein n=1 Tax=Botrytis fragariae TaxID=1964551 RepID=A0A8H6AJN5_9HELO|nr:uncharacterized protein Bfra_011924 [Botrytis fragariae]KAF5868958.1 hypothetical protein Bfra_011924 [Botrytis fragariae]